MKKLADRIKRVGVTANSGKVSGSGADVVVHAAGLIESAGRRVFTDASTAQSTGLRASVQSDAVSLTKAVDLLLVFGGDGTLLRVARDTAGAKTPILGINIGGLGFLTAVSSADLPRALRDVWEGEFILESRALIQVDGTCRGKAIRSTALNDFVIGRGIASRLVELHVSVDGAALTRYRCDGLIISSPTGSTAYSLAAGGAVVFPTAEVLQITPICPHTLSNRSMIVPLDSEICVKVVNPLPATILSADGQIVSELSTGDTVTISRSKRAVRLMHLRKSSFFESLRAKLHWRGANL